jgi:hypothetical protein
MPALLSAFLKLFAKWILPLLIFLWPYLKEVVMWVAKHLLGKQAEKLKEWAKTRMDRWEETATKRKEKADESVDHASNRDEKARAQREADAWREMASHLRKENEDLRERLKAREMLPGVIATPRITHKDGPN